MGDRVQANRLMGQRWLLVVVLMSLVVLGCTSGSMDAGSEPSTSASRPVESSDGPVDRGEPDGPRVEALPDRGEPGSEPSTSASRPVESSDGPVDGGEPDGPRVEALPDRGEPGPGADPERDRSLIADRVRSERVLRECQQSVGASLNILRGQLRVAAGEESPLRPSLVTETQGALRRCAQQLSSDVVDGVGSTVRARSLLKERSRELVTSLDQLRDAEGLEEARFDVARRTVLDLTERWEQSLERNLQPPTN